MIKAVFFDVDGTLVSFKTHRVPQSTLEAIKKITSKRNKGVCSNWKTSFNSY